MTIFVDMDGVLFDFDSHYEAVFGVRASKVADNVDWKRVSAHPNFYATMPLMPDALELWRYVSRHSPTILTGVPASIEEAPGNKRAAIARHISPHVPVICCRSREKFVHGKPGDVLIDDWTKYRGLWEGIGGIWITHSSARTTIKALRELGL